MKKTTLLSAIVVTITILFFSCNKEEDSLIVENKKTSLSFHIINDHSIKQKGKQSNSNVRIPAFADLILKQGDIYVAGSETTPFRLNINPVASDSNGDGATHYSTEESAILKLFPGIYTLEYCTVLDQDENVMWIAPINDFLPGGIDDLVEHSLPMDISLGSGAYQYQDVEVVFFDDRDVNQYGYLFYNLQDVQLIDFCIFGNYCDETGRHAEYTRYSVGIWKYSDNPLFPKGEPLYEDVENEVIATDYEDYAEIAAVPLCLSLPDGPGLDEYYVEITMIEPGTANEIIRSGIISDIDLRDLFNGNDQVDYYHFREGNCNLADSPVLLSDPREIADSN
ncbi:MAG: hypothetical protein WBL27_13230 [Salinimicrobium sp.]